MRRSRRLDEIPGLDIDRVAAAAGDDPDVLRLENLDTDVQPGDEDVARATREWERRRDEPVERLGLLGDRVRAALA